MLVVIMQLNGEGTPVDVPGARASFRACDRGEIVALLSFGYRFAAVSTNAR
jgi:hypothetical protein